MDDKMLDRDAMVHVDGISGDRAVNSAMRLEYRALSDAEKVALREFKDIGNEFLGRLLKVFEARTRLKYPNVEFGANYDFSVPAALDWEAQRAHQAIEEAVMWAVKYISKSGEQHG